MKSIVLFPFWSSPAAPILAVVKAIAGTVPVTETQLAIASTKATRTPNAFCTVSGANVHAAILLFRGRETLHFESLFQFLQRKPFRDPFLQRA
jgi:hypothetical protein